MNTYEVKYKTTGSFFWKTIKKVKGDGFANKSSNGVEFKPIRWFVLEDESAIEIPMDGTSFKFSKERHFSIRKDMSNTAGQEIRINER